MVVENRNTEESRVANCWVKVANKYNDPTFLPVTSMRPDTHSDFTQPIHCPHEAVSHMTPATPGNVEEKWNTMNFQLKHVIQNWKKSGQGSGGFIEEDDVFEDEEEDEDKDINNDAEKQGFTFGSLANRPPQSLELRRNFVDKRSTYLLYLWDMLIEHDLFQMSMQQLADGIGSGNSHSRVSSVIGSKHKNEDNDSFEEEQHQQ
jgi:hypothetical protein